MDLKLLQKFRKNCKISMSQGRKIFAKNSLKSSQRSLKIQVVRSAYSSHPKYLEKLLKNIFCIATVKGPKKSTKISLKIHVKRSFQYSLKCGIVGTFFFTKISIVGSLTSFPLFPMLPKTLNNFKKILKKIHITRTFNRLQGLFIL